METEMEKTRPKYPCVYDNVLLHVSDGTIACPLIEACNETKDNLKDAGYLIPENYCLADLVRMLIINIFAHKTGVKKQ